MFTGSSHLAMKTAKAVIVALALALALAGCHNSKKKHDSLDKENITCGSKCDDGRFKHFAGQAVHLEIEPTDELSQVFYNIDPLNCAKHAIALKTASHVTGTVRPIEMLPIDVFAPTDKPESDDSFRDIIAIPTINRISFLSPRTAIMRSRLQNDANFG